MSNPVQAENSRIAAALRRMADNVEGSKHAHCWHARVTSSEPVYVTLPPSDGALDGMLPASFGAVRGAVFIGDADFTTRMKDHLDREL